MCLGVDMAYYAFLDDNNVVTEVIVGKDEGEDGIDWEQHYSSFRGQPCKRTSYNTIAGVHSQGKEPFRKNFAGIGYTYNAELDSFIPPQPYSSWTLNEETAQWEPPVFKPDNDNLYNWDEATNSWVLVEG
jgi:hypothetical protein